MKTIVASILAAVSFGAQAVQTVDTPAFKLRLEGDWQAEKASGPEQRTYYSKALDVELATSYMLYKAKPADTERIAQKLKEVRLAGEDNTAAKFGLRMTIVQPIVVPFSKGHQVAYWGHDSNGRQFRYLGLVFAFKTVSIYAESPTRSQSELEGAFNKLLKGLSP